MTNPNHTRIIDLQNLIFTAPSMKIMLEHMKEQQSLIDSLSIDNQSLIYKELGKINQEQDKLKQPVYDLS
jgi:hypothetical protein